MTKRRVQRPVNNFFNKKYVYIIDSHKKYVYIDLFISFGAHYTIQLLFLKVFYLMDIIINLFYKGIDFKQKVNFL